MTYKFYRAQVTNAGYVPQGECQAVLTLDDNRTPTWRDVSDEFREFCLPWFDKSIHMSKMIQDPEPLKPYSEEALDHLSKHQLPSQGYMMMKVQAEPAKPKPLGHPQAGPLTPPPGLFKKKK